MTEKHRIYLDHAATTPVNQEVLDTMIPYFNSEFGNASSVYSYGRTARIAIEKAKNTIADVIHSLDSEIFFTSGGTESDNWAIRGVMQANEKKGKHIITSTIEHHAVWDTCKKLKKEGYEVTFLPVDGDGLININELNEAIREDTVMVSIMFANNEIGTIQPIEEIGALCKEKNVLFHTDAIQAVGHLEIDVEKMNINLLSMSAHKFGGPKGVGALYVKKGTRIGNLMYGGGQEKSKRPGTYNHVGIIGLAKALEISYKNIKDESKRQLELREALIQGISDNIEEVRLNGHPTKRLPNNVNMSFKYIEGESLLLSLDIMGISASSGSACTSGSLDPSHVLLAIGLDHATAHGSLRLTLGETNTRKDIEDTIDALIPIVKRLRNMSPLYVKGEQS
ncbi:MAG: cysteine desulfurase NifS [Clostridiales bacterium]|nr:cysteine desulfurase NifS [Clostridiales bacterium]